MKRKYGIPKNPELIGAIAAALRIHAGHREPENATEQRLAKLLAESRVSRGHSARLLENFDSLPKSTRDLLGKSGLASYNVPARSRELPVLPIPTITIPAEAVIERTRLHGVFTEVFSDGVLDAPTYTVRYRGLFCQKETSWDRFSNSDEIYIITSAVHIAQDHNHVKTERHPVSATQKYYDDVDSYEERIGPVAATWVGNSDPLSLTVAVFEQDYGDPDKYKDDIDTLVKGAIAALIILYPKLAPLTLLSGHISDAINWFIDTGDDLISTETIILPRLLLESYSTQGYTVQHQGYKLQGSIPNLKVVPLTTNLHHHFLTRHKSNGADYIVGFDVIRDPELTREPILL
jgi:hypothetical protein